MDLEKLELHRKKQLILNLKEHGVIELLKEDYVFTLLMFNDVKFLDDAKLVFKIFELCTDYCGNRYPIVEVVKNESNYLLIILKP